MKLFHSLLLFDSIRPTKQEVLSSQLAHDRSSEAIMIYDATTMLPAISHHFSSRHFRRYHFFPVIRNSVLSWLRRSAVGRTPFHVGEYEFTNFGSVVRKPRKSRAGCVGRGRSAAALDARYHSYNWSPTYRRFLFKTIDTCPSSRPHSE